MTTKCGRCNRHLKNPIYQQIGYGKVCWAKLRADMEKQTNGDTALLPFDQAGGDIVLRREGGKKYVNVPHTIVKHSPTGLEWGYSGSGPADLALNILAMIQGKEFAFEHYQAFKEVFVAGIPTDGGIIKRTDIDNWIAGKIQERRAEELA